MLSWRRNHLAANSGEHLPDMKGTRGRHAPPRVSKSTWPKTTIRRDARMPGQFLTQAWPTCFWRSVLTGGNAAMGDVLLAQEFALSFYERAVLNVA